MNDYFLETLGFVFLVLTSVGILLFLSYVIAIIFEIRDEVYTIKNKLRKGKKK